MDRSKVVSLVEGWIVPGLTEHYKHGDGNHSKHDPRKQLIEITILPLCQDLIHGVRQTSGLLRMRGKCRERARTITTGIVDRVCIK